MSKQPLFTDEQIKIFMQQAGWDKLTREELEERVSEELNKLVDEGQIERLIGEDGEFYYRSIER